MDYQALQGKTIHGEKGASYRLFRYVYDTSDEYHLPIFSGEKTRDQSKITIIAFDVKDQSKLENRLSLYMAKTDLNYIDKGTINRINFLIFDVLSSEFENIFQNLPAEKSPSPTPEMADGGELLSKVKEGVKSKSGDQHPVQKRTPYQIIIMLLIVFFCLGAVSGGLFSIRYFASPTVGIAPILSITPVSVTIPSNSPLPLITPSITDIIIPTEKLNTLTPEQTLTFLTTDTSMPTNTPISTGTQPTLTSSATPTITPVPFREGLPGEIKLKVRKIGNIRSVPSTSSDKTILGKRNALEVGQYFWFKAQLLEGNRTWLQIGPDQWMTWTDDLGYHQSLYLNDGWISYKDLLEKDDILVSTLPVVTLTTMPEPTSTTLAITPTP